MTFFNWFKTLLVIIALTSFVNCSILKQQFVPPSPKKELKLPLTEQDQSRISAAIKHLNTSGSEDGPYPWELSGLIEGDMLMDPQQRDTLLNNRTLWPNGTVPYYVEESEFTDQEKLILLKSIKEYHNRTCIRFRPYHQNDTNWIVFRSNSSGCWSSVGMQSEGQTVNLQSSSCVTHGTAIHELLHALGFFHQQSASNRDDFVRIQWENVENGTEHSFDKLNSSVVTDHVIEYDYVSIMHYSAKAFSKNGKPTIVALKPNVTIGQSKGLSEKDVAKLEKMYGNQCEQHPNPEPEEFLDQFNALLSALGNSTTPTGSTNATISNITTSTAATPNITISIVTSPSVTIPGVTTPRVTTSSITTSSVTTPKATPTTDTSTITTPPQVISTQKATTPSATTTVPKKPASHSRPVFHIPIFSDLAKRVLDISFG